MRGMYVVPSMWYDGQSLKNFKSLLIVHPSVLAIALLLGKRFQDVPFPFLVPFHFDRVRKHIHLKQMSLPKINGGGEIILHGGCNAILYFLLCKQRRGHHFVVPIVRQIQHVPRQQCHQHCLVFFAGIVVVFVCGCIVK